MSEPLAFYVSLTCPQCDQEVYEGLIVTALNYRDRPVVPLSTFSQMTVECAGCGTTIYTDDMEDHVVTEDDL